MWGTVVERHEVPEKEVGYSVEFFDLLGHTVALITVPGSWLCPNTARLRKYSCRLGEFGKFAEVATLLPQAGRSSLRGRYARTLRERTLRERGRYEVATLLPQAGRTLRERTLPSVVNARSASSTLVHFVNGIRNSESSPSARTLRERKDC